MIRIPIGARIAASAFAVFLIVNDTYGQTWEQANPRPRQYGPSGDLDDDIPF
jgi:hypothetical protein